MSRPTGPLFVRVVRLCDACAFCHPRELSDADAAGMHPDNLVYAIKKLKWSRNCTHPKFPGRDGTDGEILVSRTGKPPARCPLREMATRTTLDAEDLLGPKLPPPPAPPTDGVVG